MKLLRINGRVDQSSETDYVISDNRTFEHVVTDINLHVSKTETSNVEVELADGSKLISRHEGSVSIDTGVTTVTLRTV